MTLPLLILRPFCGAQKTVTAAGSFDLNAVVDPLFELRPLSWKACAADQYDAIMFTSANALDMAGPGLSEYLSLPVLAVGKATAHAAIIAGFKIAATGKGGVQSLIKMLDDDSYFRILRLSGRKFTPVHSDRAIETIPVYESVTIGLGQAARQCLNSGCVTLLHSTKAAEVLVDEMKKNQISRNDNHIITISTAVANAAGTGWKSTNFAGEPTDEALLSLAARLCCN